MRKFLSLVLMAALISAMTVSMPLSASAENVCDWQYFDTATTNLYDQVTGKFFTLASDASGTVTYHADGDGISSEPVVDIASTNYVCNYFDSISSSKPVINLGFKMYIPEGKLQNKSRAVYFSLSKKDSAGSYNNAGYGMVKFGITSAGKFYGGASQNATCDYDKRIDCTTDTWHQINIRAFRNFEGELIFGMYVNGSLLTVVSSTVSDIAAEDVGISQINFRNNDTTYIKDLRMDIEDYDAAYAPTLTESVPDVSYLNNVQFNTIKADATTNALTAPGYGDATADLKTSPQTSGHYKNGSTYENINYTLDDDALKVDLTPSAESSGTHALIQDLKKDVTSYFPSGTTKYMQMSYDIKIPAGTETTQRQQYWRLGNDSVTKYNYCYELHSNIVDGKLQFTNKSTYKGGNSTLKSTSFDIQNDKWYRIIFLLGITNGNAYAIHSEGYVYDMENNTTSKIYEQVVNIPKLKAGVDTLILSQQRTDIITPAVSDAATISTYYDNITTRISAMNFSDYYVNLADQIPVSPVELTAADGVATVIGRSEDGAGEQVMLIAGYDKNGKLVSCGISGDSTDANTDIDTKNGSVTFTWDFSSQKNIISLKAFMLKSLNSVAPLSGAVSSDIYKLTPVYTDGEGISDIDVAEELNIDFNSFGEVNSSYNKRAFCVKDNHLYITNQFYVYNIDISNPNDPVLVARTELSNVKEAYNIMINDFKTQFPTNLTGVYIYNDKLIITTRMAINSMHPIMTADGGNAVKCGSVTMLNLSDLSIVDEVILDNRRQVSPGGIYKDVLIAGLVHGGIGAWKITDTGFTELLMQGKPDGFGAEFEYQAGAVDVDSGTVYFSQYKYGVRKYTISYDGNENFVLENTDQLRFMDEPMFYRSEGGAAAWTHAAMGLTVKDGHVFVPIAPIRALVPELNEAGDNHSGVLVADMNNLNDYTLYELPSSAVPAQNVDNVTDQQPMFADFSDTVDDELFVHLGDKGICRYKWTGSELVYCERWGDVPNTETETVKVFDGKVYAIYRYVDGSLNILLKSWDIIR